MSKKFKNQAPLGHYLRQYICMYNWRLNRKKYKSARSDWLCGQKVNKSANWRKTKFPVVYGYGLLRTTNGPIKMQYLQINKY